MNRQQNEYVLFTIPFLLHLNLLLIIGTALFNFKFWLNTFSQFCSESIQCNLESTFVVTSPCDDFTMYVFISLKYSLYVECMQKHGALSKKFSTFLLLEIGN